MIKISKKASSIAPSLTRHLFNLASKFDDVIDLTLGDPDLIPAEKIRLAACDAIKKGKTRYSANAGLKQLRNAISDHIKKEYGTQIDPEGNIIVTVGGMEALYLALSSIIDEGDEVIIPGPYYVNYVQMVKMCGGVPVIINTDEKKSFSFTSEQIESAVTERTVAIIINNPCNPTGQILNNEVLTSLGKIAKANDLVVISDEVYSSLIYDNAKHQSLFKDPAMSDRVILIDSISKRFAMTGYRVGYAAGPKDVISAMTKMQENVAACAPLPSQYAAIVAYEKCDDDTHIHDEFEMRRDYIYKAVNEIDGLSALKPAATFYLFVNISKTGLDSLTFAKKLLEEAHVAVAPGITYGKAYDSYIRIAFTLEIPKLEEGVQRISKFMKKSNSGKI